MMIATSYPGIFMRVSFRKLVFSRSVAAQHSFALFREYGTAELCREQPRSSRNWQLCAAVCLVRLPLITQPPTEIESKYFELLRQQEYEQSVLSLWEIEHKRQTGIMDAVESGDRDPQDIDFKTTNQDIEDEYDAKLKEFVDTKRQELNVDNDLKDIHRKMHESLVYVVKQKLGNDEIWLLPNLQVYDNETMRQCAERTIRTYKADDFHARILSTAPSSFYKYAFPKSVRLKRGEYGAKMFIYSALSKCSVGPMSAKRFDKSLAEDTSTLDYAWVTMDEMKNRLKPKYFDAIRNLL